MNDFSGFLSYLKTLNYLWLDHLWSPSSLERSSINLSSIFLFWALYHLESSFCLVLYLKLKEKDPPCCIEVKRKCWSNKFSPFLDLCEYKALSFPCYLLDLVLCHFMYLFVPFVCDIGVEWTPASCKHFMLLVEPYGQIKFGPLTFPSSYASLGRVLKHLECKSLDIGCYGMS